MNRYSLKAHLMPHLEPFASTLKDTSFDTANQQYLCNDQLTADVYDFDRYVKERCPHPVPASPDAIHIGHNHVYFVEFKNAAAVQVDGEQMRSKFEAGTYILKNLLQAFKSSGCQYHFCVVLKNQTRPRWMDFRHVESSKVKFGLQELNQRLGNFYDTVVTEGLDFYVRNFTQLRCE